MRFLMGQVAEHNNKGGGGKQVWIKYVSWGIEKTNI